MTIVNVCAGGRSFEWRNGELFIVSSSQHGDTVWISADTMEEVRRACPEGLVDDGFPVFVIVRSEVGDRVLAVETPITFAGGDVLCFVKPIVSH